MEPETDTSIAPVGWPRRLVPFLILFALGAALGGIALTILLPSQIFKPEAIRAQALVERDYREMIDAGVEGFPRETTAYLSREECWTKGKVLCVYGWYAEWKGAVYLMSFTYAGEAEERQGRLRGWWWEVDVEKEEVRPVWQVPELQREYGLRETEEFRRLVKVSGEVPTWPTVSPLIKIP